MHVDLNFNEPQASDICMHEIKEGSSSDEADVHSLSEPSGSLDGGVSISGSFPNPGPSDGTGGCIPYCGEVRGGTYNTQALFAATAKKHLRKRSKARSLIFTNDFGCLQGTHGREGKTLAFHFPNG